MTVRAIIKLTDGKKFAVTAKDDANAQSALECLREVVADYLGQETTLIRHIKALESYERKRK